MNALPVFSSKPRSSYLRGSFVEAGAFEDAGVVSAENPLGEGQMFAWVRRGSAAVRS